MAYIPEEHKKYNLLSFCRENGGEVFEYPCNLVNSLSSLIDDRFSVTPYGFLSYEEYFAYIDEIKKFHCNDKKIISMLDELIEEIGRLNRKEEWSVLKYIGPSDNSVFGLTNGNVYYFPTTSDNPVYNGIIDDEEFTAYLYYLDTENWIILEAPTGMAKRALKDKSLRGEQQ